MSYERRRKLKQIKEFKGLLVDGAHCVEHHGKPTDCLQEVCFRSKTIKIQIATSDFQK